MRFVVAPDSYKGSVPATEVALAMARGIRQVFSTAEVITIPIADGGEGAGDSNRRAISLQFRGRTAGRKSFGKMGNTW